MERDSGWTVDTLHAYVLEVVDQLRRERVLDKAEVDRHFQLKAEHFRMLEAQLDARFQSVDRNLTERTGQMVAMSADRFLWIKERFEMGAKQTEERFRVELTLHNTIQASIKETITKGERQNELRFESVNEFRRALSDQTANFLTRAAFEEAQKSLLTYHETINARFEQVQNRLNLYEGQSKGIRETRDDTRSNWSMVVAISSVAITVLLTIIPLLTRSVSPTPAAVGPTYTLPPGYRIDPPAPLK